MLDARLRPALDPIVDGLAQRAAGLGLTANAVTLAGFATGLVAVALIACGYYLPGLLLFALNRLADELDGALARRQGITDWGGYLDIVLDFLIYSGVVFGFALADPARNALAGAFLILSFVGTGSSFLAYAVMAARRGLVTTARGQKSLYYLGGLTEGSETILALALFCLFPRHFPVLASGFGALCWITTISRILIAGRTLR